MAGFGAACKGDLFLTVALLKPFAVGAAAFFLKWRFANVVWRAWDVYHGLTVLETDKNSCDHSWDADTLMRLVVGCECALRLMIF